MLSMFIFFLESFLMGFIILLLPMIFYKKEKMINQIESGFQTLNKTSLKSFSINFFFLLIIFIIFDLELIFIFNLVEKNNIFILLFVMIFIISTLWLEWFLNKIKWIN